jgi:uncharacterized protein YdaU (DUF1376 family)
MTKVRYVDFSPDEFIAGVVGMKAEEIGVYWTICALIYSTGGSIQFDERLKRCSGCHGNKLNAVLRRLEDLGKIVRKGSEIIVKRCGKELEKAQNRSRKALENGEKGGRPSKETNDLTKPDGFSDEKLTTNHQPPTTNQKKESPLPPNGGGDDLFKSQNDEFESFWREYPRRAGKGQARKAFRAALKKTTFPVLIAGARRYAKEVSGNGKDPQYIRYPATWLTGEDWDDEPAKEKKRDPNDIFFS